VIDKISDPAWTEEYRNRILDIFGR